MKFRHCILSCWHHVFLLQLFIQTVVKSCEIHPLYLFLCQASVADPTVPGRPDDGTAWEKERRERAEDTSRGRARSPGNILILQ